MNGGYFTLGSWRGAPIRLHWSFFILALWVGGRSPGAWVGFFLLILVHEIGHGVLVRWCKHRVLEIQISGIGGACVWDGPSGMLDESLIAWGGVWAQGLLFCATQTLLDAGIWPSSNFASQILSVFLGANVWIMLFNLIPIPPLDGSRAWLLFPGLYQRARWDDSARKLANTKPPQPQPPEATVPIDDEKEALFQKILVDLTKRPPVSTTNDEQDQ